MDKLESSDARITHNAKQRVEIWTFSLSNQYFNKQVYNVLVDGGNRRGSGILHIKFKIPVFSCYKELCIFGNFYYVL